MLNLFIHLPVGNSAWPSPHYSTKALRPRSKRSVPQNPAYIAGAFVGNDIKKDNAIGWVTELRIVETVISGKECRTTKPMQ